MVGWNVFVYFIALSWYLLYAFGIWIVFNEDVLWAFFDNFYTGLQVIASNYEDYV